MVGPLKLTKGVGLGDKTRGFKFLDFELNKI